MKPRSMQVGLALAAGDQKMITPSEVMIKESGVSEAERKVISMTCICDVIEGAWI